LTNNEARQWIAAAGWKAHIKSELHHRALALDQDTQHQQIQIDRAAQAVMAENAMPDFVRLEVPSSSVAPPVLQ
jgi:hypothetical protein